MLMQKYVTISSLNLTIFFSRRTYWEICPPAGQLPLASDGKGAAGVEFVLLPWKRARSFLGSLNYVWGKWSFMGYNQVMNLSNSFKWGWVKISTNSRFNSCAASRTNCTSSHLRRPTRSFSQTPDGTYFLQCPGLLAKFPSLDLHRQERALCVNF